MFAACVKKTAYAACLRANATRYREIHALPGQRLSDAERKI